MEIPAQIEDKYEFGVNAETVYAEPGTELEVYILALLLVTPIE